MTVSFPQGHSWHILLLLSPLYLGVHFLLRGKYSVPGFGLSSELWENSHCSLCLQPPERADGEIGNQRPVLLESLSWLRDAKRCYQLINSQPASFLHDKTSSIQQGRL